MKFTSGIGPSWWTEMVDTLHCFCTVEFEENRPFPFSSRYEGIKLFYRKQLYLPSSPEWQARKKEYDLLFFFLCI